MKDLTFNITYSGHTFTVINKPSTSYCFYNTTGKYKASLLFAKNTYAFLEYKNIQFSGTVTKRDNWTIKLDLYPIIKKYSNKYFSETPNNLKTTTAEIPQNTNDIIISNFDSQEYSVFLNTLGKRIDKIISDMYAPESIKDEIYNFCVNHYSVNYIPSEKELIQDINHLISVKSGFYTLYDKFISLFGTDVINLEWTDENIQLFKRYDKKELPVDAHHVANYEVYQHVIPYYKRCFFISNTNKYKPVIEKFPDFVSYASSVFDILFKYNLLIDGEEKVIYDEDGDIDSAYKELEELITK